MRNLIAGALIALAAIQLTSAPVLAEASPGVVVLGNYYAKDLKMVMFNHATDPQAVYKEYNEWSRAQTDKVYLVATQFMFAGNQWVLNVHYYTRP